MMKYLYNGIELLGIPEWDKSAYPYVFIILNGENAYLAIATDTPWTVWGESISPDVACKAIRTYYRPLERDYWYYSRIVDFEVTYFEGWQNYDITDPNIISHYAPFWSNYDVLNEEDGTLYLAASEPVPVVPKVSPQLAFTIGKQLGRRIFK